MTIAMACTALMATPAYAQSMGYQSETSRNGTFVGARLSLSFSGRKAPQPKASLAIAPTRMQLTSRGPKPTQVSEGIALSFGPHEKSRLTIAGAPAASILGMQSQSGKDSDKKLGISTGGWIGIGLGVVAVAGAIYFVHMVDEARDNTD